jgi:hypothetical protein
MNYCENPTCKNKLSADHITLVTTAHVRRFCYMDCLIESYYRHLSAGAVEAGYSPNEALHATRKELDDILVRCERRI